MKRTGFIITGMIAAVSLLQGCYYDVEEELYPVNNQQCDTADVTYTTRIAPLLQQNCTSCHSGSFASGNIDLTDYAVVKSRAVDGSLYGTITHSPGFTPMPQGGNKLSDCNIAMVKAWIDKGALNN